MAFFKCSSIYDVTNVLKWGFWIPDGTLNPDSSVCTRAKDIIFLVLFELLYIILLIFVHFNDRHFFESSSKMLNGGLNTTFKLGFIALFVSRLVLFGYRYKFWEVVKSLESCDLLVSDIQNDEQI
jgi:hypothetical protein